MGLFKSFFSPKKKESLDKGLKKTNKSFLSKLGNILVGKSKVDIEVLDDLEEILISSDVGVQTTIKIIDSIEKRVLKDKYINTSELDIILKEEILNILTDSSLNKGFDFFNTKSFSPYVIMIVGVNGVGKTTTIGKLAYKYSDIGKKVLLGASDTFRAGAIDQLQIWADRANVELIKQKMGSDPASVAHDTLESGLSKKSDVILIDTAGRLHNKINLMNELTKVKKVMNNVIPNAPHEVILVLDGSTGQNAFEQAKQFTQATEVNSLIVTKLDGTAKGGVVMGISDQFQIPVKFIGVGESIEDLQVFDPKLFVDSFFKRNN
jgi:fused signal recognition particle receptor|tara:strand:+ start:705 stop:1667 length:963 start_codon:yes stop_codon:yes gene_type:complete